MIKKTGYFFIALSFILVLSPLFYMSKNIFIFLTLQSYGPIFVFAIGSACIFSGQTLVRNGLPIFSITLIFSVFSDCFSLYIQPKINELAANSSTNNLSVSVSRPSLPGILIMFLTDLLITYAITIAFIYVTNKFRLKKNKLRA